jgi:hypothetical protein
MTKFRIFRDAAILSMMIATQAQAHMIRGREVAAPSLSAARMTDRGGDAMWIYRGRSDHAGKKNVLPPEVDAPNWIGD